MKYRPTPSERGEDSHVEQGLLWHQAGRMISAQIIKQPLF